MKLPNKVLQLKNCIYNSKNYFNFFSININFFLNLCPEIYIRDSSLLLFEAKILIFSIVQKEKRQRDDGEVC
jgi:hypothetical protein